jgi:hypothetical protein
MGMASSLLYTVSISIIDHRTEEMLDTCIFVTIRGYRALSRSFSGHLMGSTMFVVYDKKLQGRRDVMLANRGVGLTATLLASV